MSPWRRSSSTPASAARGARLLEHRRRGVDADHPPPGRLRDRDRDPPVPDRQLDQRPVAPRGRARRRRRRRPSCAPTTPRSGSRKPRPSSFGRCYACRSARATCRPLRGPPARRCAGCGRRVPATTVRSLPGGGIPKRSLTPWTTSVGTSTASSSGSRLGAGRRPRRGGSSGKARQTTPIAPVAAAVRHATRAPDERPPATSGSPASAPRAGASTTAIHAASSWCAGAGVRRPATRYGCSTSATATLRGERRVGRGDQVGRADAAARAVPEHDGAARLGGGVDVGARDARAASRSPPPARQVC